MVEVVHVAPEQLRRLCLLNDGLDFLLVFTFLFIAIRKHGCHLGFHLVLRRTGLFGHIFMNVRG